MGEKPLVSIIVPVYNGRKYISECVNSIQNQTYKNIEILLVNDGSTDGTDKMLAEFAMQDNRITVLNIENSGVSFARKVGVNASHGTYICFVDADDYILPYYVECFISSLKSGISIYCLETADREISATEWLCGLLKNEYSWFLHHKMYKKDVLTIEDALNVPREISIGEDLVTNIRICQSGSVIFLNSKGYVYRDNPNSASRNRKFSLSYEEKFMEEVEKALGNRVEKFSNELWTFKLRVWKVLIEHNVKVPRKKMWVQQLLKNRPQIPIGFGDKLVLVIKNHYMALYALRMLSILRRIIIHK